MITQWSIEYLREEYSRKERSLDDIAKEWNTYPNKVRRALLKCNIPLRNKSDAQSAALKSGRHGHPTKGQHRPPEVKEKIGREVSLSWNNLPPEDKEKRSTESKEQWASMSADQRAIFQRKAAKAVREAAVNGSRMEKFLRDKLLENGVLVEFHKDNFLGYSKLHVDLYLPKYKTAIEVDGPTHFENIWGTEHLARRQAADQVKNGIVKSIGLNLIRVRVFRKNLSNVYQMKIFNELMSILKQLQEHPPEGPQLLFIEGK